MPLQSKFNFGAIQITINAKDEIELFQAVSIFGELPCQCGKCESKNIFPAHRQTEDKDDYYNLRCRDCGAQFDVGQKKAGGLFPKYDPKDRNKCVKGWYLYADQDFSNKGGRDRDDHRDDRRDRDRGGRDDRRDNDRGRGDDRGRSSGGGGGGGYGDDDIPF